MRVGDKRGESMMTTRMRKRTRQGCKTRQRWILSRRAVATQQPTEEEAAEEEKKQRLQEAQLQQ